MTTQYRMLLISRRLYSKAKYSRSLSTLVPSLHHRLVNELIPFQFLSSFNHFMPQVHLNTDRNFNSCHTHNTWRRYYNDKLVMSYKVINAVDDRKVI